MRARSSDLGHPHATLDELDKAILEALQVDGRIELRFVSESYRWGSQVGGLA